MSEDQVRAALEEVKQIAVLALKDEDGSARRAALELIVGKAQVALT